MLEFKAYFLEMPIIHGTPSQMAWRRSEGQRVYCSLGALYISRHFGLAKDWSLHV